MFRFVPLFSAKAFSPIECVFRILVIPSETMNLFSGFKIPTSEIVPNAAYLISVFGIGCTHHYRSPEALKVTEPRAFGFDLDYVPLEEID